MLNAFEDLHVLRIPNRIAVFGVRRIVIGSFVKVLSVEQTSHFFCIFLRRLDTEAGFSRIPFAICDEV